MKLNLIEKPDGQYSHDNLANHGLDPVTDAYQYLANINAPHGAVVIRKTDGTLVGLNKGYYSIPLAIGNRVTLDLSTGTGVVVAERFSHQSAGRFINAEGRLQAVDFANAKLIRPGDGWNSVYREQASGVDVRGQTVEYGGVTLTVIDAGEEDGTLWNDFKDGETGEIADYYTLLFKIDQRRRG